MSYGAATEIQIAAVVKACEDYGKSSIIALSGVPATGKSFVAAIAAQRFAGEPTRVREVQFHQSFTYEEFVEGLRIGAQGAVEPVSGVFLEWNERALEDGKLKYVLLIEELTRANLGSVLGELLTYVEHRDRNFHTMFSRKSMMIAKNLTIVATYNPVDRSAIDIDDALLRRLRIIDMPPDDGQLEEMLTKSGLALPIIQRLKGVFNACRAKHAQDYDVMMPFGHGIFAEVTAETDLNPLWHQRIRRMLYRPLLDPHAFAETISAAYPWRDASYSVPFSSTAPGPATAEPTLAASAVESPSL